MKHLIIGGDGFVGRRLAADLLAAGEEVVVADIADSARETYRGARFVQADVTDAEAMAAFPIGADDVVYNMSARMLSPIMPRARRHDFFWPVNYTGTENILKAMRGRDASRLVHFTTDMVYGHSETVPQTEDHPTRPLGEYGESKLATERLAEDYRAEGMNISIFRPRLIIGPGRLGILVKLFKLIDMSLPVPMIGSGRNPYQFVSVYDCAQAAMCAWRAGLPNGEYNIGSDNPPPVRTLLGDLIARAQSRSILVPTPGFLVKAVLNTLDRVNMPIMDPEQYLIADEYCVLDCSKAKREVGWRPRFSDSDMLIAAYAQYRASLGDARYASGDAPVPAE